MISSMPPVATNADPADSCELARVLSDFVGRIAVQTDELQIGVVPDAPDHLRADVAARDLEDAQSATTITLWTLHAGLIERRSKRCPCDRRSTEGGRCLPTSVVRPWGIARRAGAEPAGRPRATRW